MANMLTTTSTQTPSALQSLAFSFLKPHQSRAQEAAMRIPAVMASALSREILSATRASTSTLGLAESEALSKVPAIDGNSATSRQKPAVRPRAQSDAFLKRPSGISPLTILSSTRKPSSGIVNCSITSAIDTVLNLL